MTGRGRRVGRDTLILFGLAIGLVCVAWAVGFASSFSIASPGPAVPDDVPVPENFGLYGEAWSYVDREFYGARPPSERVVRGAVQGLVETLNDPHAAFVPPESAASASEAYQPSFVPTMGLWFEPVAGGAQILAVLPGSPAADAGLVAGDVVLAIGQEALAAVDPVHLAAALDPTAVPAPSRTPRVPVESAANRAGATGAARGVGTAAPPATNERRSSPVPTDSGVAAPAATERPAATDRPATTERPTATGGAPAGPGDASVTLIARGPDAAPRSVTVRRGRVAPPIVEVAQGDAGVQVLHVGRLDPSVVPEIDALLDGPLAGATALVIDLRDNPGGDLETLAAVAGRFFAGPAWLEVGADVADGAEIAHDAARPSVDSLPDGVHLVVLMNEGTAGTAEMLAGALRDRRQARIVGARSFGRGTVQSEWTLDDGSWLRMTTAEWRTPAGTPVDGVGLAPDESVFGAEAQLAAAERAAAESARGG